MIQDLFHPLVGKGTFGPTGSLHKDMIVTIWGPGANVAIFLVFYSYRKWWVWLHSIFFLLGGIYIIATALPIVFFTGIIYQDTPIDTSHSKYILNKHYILGLTCLSGIALVIILGVTLRLMGIFHAKTTLILTIRKIHRLSGYVILLACKANMYLMTKSDDLALLIVQDVIFVVLLVSRKLTFPKMEAKEITPKYEELEIRKITSLNELNPSGSYTVFANFVYKTDQLNSNHPAGYQIIKAVENKEVDRYIYGSCTNEELPEIQAWSHSFRSFKLLGNPIAKIDIPQTFSGFDAPEVQCKVLEVRLFSEKSSVYQLSLAKRTGPPFQWLKYRNINQLGRYYSLSINQKVTRLYTNVNFLVDENKQFLSKFLQWEDRGVNKNLHVYWSDLEDPNPTQAHIDVHRPLNPNEVYQTENYENNLTRTSAFPLMLKAYPKGQLTRHITDKPVTKIMLSSSKGEGLRLPHTKPGRIIIVAGGTGLFPFSDLIDLLYKQQLMEKDPSCREEVLKVSPILIDNPFKQWSFQLLAAFNSIDDIHSITFEQLVFLSQRNRIKTTLKLKVEPAQKLKVLTTTQLRFEDELEKELQNRQDIAKVWICGPPLMNQELVRLLKEKYQMPDIYLIV